MDVFKNYVTKQLPAYLQSLPIPSNLEGFAELSQDEIIAIVPFFLLLSSMIVMIVIHLLPEDKKRQRLNTTHRLSEPKVVDKVSTPKGEKDVYCRCWQSKTFPLCDGSHNAYNKETGDNLGPLIVTK